MWTETPVFRNDLERLAGCECIPWDELRGKRVFITGATGLIGYTVASALLYYNKIHNAGIDVIALVRDLDKAGKKFKGQLADKCGLSLIRGKVEDPLKIDGAVDYIIHGASPTASAFFVEKPVETILTSVMGTRNMLELARRKNSSGFVFLSSMEVYGAPQTDDLIDEGYPTAVDAMSVRSSYPQAKLLCETLCASYCGEYSVPAKVVRLAQTFGPGTAQDDRRVFAQFARSVLKKEDIVLRTSGESKRTYLYTADAASAILTILLRGNKGQVYNASNQETYCSIVEMAQMAAGELGGGEINVVMRLGDTRGAGFSPVHCLRLSSEKLCGLGWHPTTGLPEMYRNMLGCFSMCE